MGRDVQIRGPGYRCLLAAVHKIPREEILRAVAGLEKLLRPADYNCFDYLERRYVYLRGFFPRFLRVMAFEAAPAAKPVLEAVDALRAWNAQSVRKPPADAPRAFIPEAWRPYVLPDGGLDRHHYELCVMTELHRGLQAAEIWAVGGRRYGNVEDLLISQETWEQVRDECCEELRLPRTAGTWLAEALGSLGRQIERTVKNLPTNPQALPMPDRVHLRAIEAASDGPALEALKAKVAESWLPVRIQDLLVDVNAWTGFSEVFRTLRGRSAGEETGLGRGLLAGLIAKGCNIGTGKMAVLTPGVTAGSLRRVDELYLHEEALRQAYEALLRAHRDLPLSRWLGNPAASMSDGMRLATRVGTLRAAIQPHAFAPGERALTYYWHVSHMGPAYGAQVIGRDRDAAYVLDQIFRIQSELPVHEHYTDTHGTTETTFGLASLFGLDYLPRIKLVHEQTLSFPPGIRVEGPFKAHFEGPVDVELIERHWDDVLRILASIKRGYTSAVLLTLRLSSYANRNPLFRALREIGRIAKSRFILRYYDEPALRRRINAGLNRMEFFNALARHLFFARRGENWEREFEQQLNRSSALLVLANACVLWNTVHLTEVARWLRLEGVDFAEEDFRHVSPYAFEHVVPYGEYHFDLRRKDRKDAYLSARQM